MKKGIVIVFSEDENRINKDELRNLSNTKNTELCLVNNGSKDNTLEVLNEVKDNLESTSISIIDIKKNIRTIAAVKAGSRYLFSIADLSYIVYLKSNILSYFKNRQFEILKKIENEFVINFLKEANRKNIKKFFSSKDFLGL
jgi:glycosyltransferase involved in cell wall biosynthesis